LPGFEQAEVKRIELASGGVSNITCYAIVEGAPLPAVGLRLQREHGIFEPYDVIREGELLRRLQGSAVPVPAVVGMEADVSWLGSPFIVMEWVDAPHMGMPEADADFATYTRMVAAIHGLDWRGLGLGFLGVPDTVEAALVSELDAVAARMVLFGCGQEPLLVRALEVLRARVPGDGRVALCQGDINVFNYLAREGRIVAVVDWEQARLSDPRSDIGQLVALSNLRGAPFGPADQAPFVQLYSAVSGEVVTGIAFFRARWLFELGVIAHGWRAFNGSEPWYGWEELCELLEAALAEL
jgi:aminoglycoside phosphotransferase (APT) family kinase protein